MGEERTYSVEEADASLPELREVLERVRSNRQVILRAAERIRGKVEPSHDQRVRVYRFRNVDGLPRRHAHGTQFDRVSTNVGTTAQSCPVAALRDPETGLIDFPSEREGRRIFLCWRLGENHVAHWHDLESGFAGRKPL